ncbi:hypothetical protein Fmac_029557 [Flemingia macrophylla]|uniref:Uncharacterized protein n=1 Tax=Flemingia macrophylla TaxID=520843 RepID=A0ABD1LAZ5_9FABA
MPLPFPSSTPLPHPVALHLRLPRLSHHFRLPLSPCLAHPLLRPPWPHLLSPHLAHPRLRPPWPHLPSPPLSPHFSPTKQQTLLRLTFLPSPPPEPPSLLPQPQCHHFLPTSHPMRHPFLLTPHPPCHPFFFTLHWLVIKVTPSGDRHGGAEVGLDLLTQRC